MGWRVDRACTRTTLLTRRLWPWWATVIGALVLVSSGCGAITLAPRERTTEFFALGPNGHAGGYPASGKPDEIASVTVGVVNREGSDHDYRIEVWVSGDAEQLPNSSLAGIDHVPPLGDGERADRVLSWRFLPARERQSVEFRLYLDDGVEVYRRLKIHVDVTDPPLGVAQPWQTINRPSAGA